MNPKHLIFGAGLVALCIYGAYHPAPHGVAPVEPAASSTPSTATPSDPCGYWRLPSGMTREQCERINAVAADLWLERERERNPNFKPFSVLQ